MTARIDVFGTEQVVRNLSNYQLNVMREIVKGAEAVQAQVINDAAQIVPVDTGNLLRSIKPGGIQIMDTDVWAFIIADADYASYVEFGTTRQKAQPYLGPSILANQRNFVTAIAAATERAKAE